MYLNTIIDLVRRTAPLLLDTSSAARVTRKGAHDYVTAVDIAVQDFLQRELTQSINRPSLEQMKKSLHSPHLYQIIT